MLKSHACHTFGHNANIQKHGDVLEPDARGHLPKNATKQERMARRLRIRKGRETYSKRNR